MIRYNIVVFHETSGKYRNELTNITNINVAYTLMNNEIRYHTGACGSECKLKDWHIVEVDSEK